MFLREKFAIAERRVLCARAAASHSPQCHSEAGSGSGEQGGSGLRAEYTNLRAGEDGSVQSIEHRVNTTEKKTVNTAEYV